VEDVFGMSKFDTLVSKRLLVFSWIQLIVLLVFVMYLFHNFAAIGFPGVLIYGIFLFVSVFSITSLLDLAPYAWIAELIRFLFVLTIVIYSGGDWFKVSEEITFGSYLVMIYMALSLMVVIYFRFTENKDSSNTYHLSSF
jgi:alkylglycerol monooxygenase